MLKLNPLGLGRKRISLASIIMLIGFVAFLTSCVPSHKAFKDRLTTTKDSSNRKGREALSEDWQQFEIEEKPVIDISISNYSDRNDLNLPKILKHGEQWLPRTLLVSDLKVIWNSNKSRIFARGRSQWTDPISKNMGSIRFSLAGNWDPTTGSSDLVMIKNEMDPLNRDQVVRGRAYCIGMNESFECNATIVEVYVRVGSVIYSGQRESGSIEETAPVEEIAHDEWPDDKEYHDGFDDLNIPMEVVDGTQAGDVETLFETEDIDGSSDVIVNAPASPRKPVRSEEDSLPKIEDTELEQIIRSINEKNRAENSEEKNFQVPSSSTSQSDEKGMDQDLLDDSETPSSSTLDQKQRNPTIKKQEKKTEGTTSEIKDARKAKNKVPIPIPQIKPIREQGKNSESLNDDEEGDKQQEDLSVEMNDLPPAPVVPPRKSHQGENLEKENTVVLVEDEEQNPELKRMTIIPGRKPELPPLTGLSDQDSGDLDDQEIFAVGGKNGYPENSLIGSFYPFQSYGYHHQRGGMKRASSLMQMIDNIQNENLTEKFRIHSSRTSKQRYYGNFASMEFLLKSSYWVNKLKRGLTLDVGDISAQKGGPIGRHKSHKNGLDMDIGYFFNGIDNQYYGRSALSANKKNFDPKFDRALLWAYLKKMMSHYHDQVYMIFVHPKIKQAMCAEATRLGELGKSDADPVDPIVFNALRRLYPEPGHDDHFHVRLRCPTWGSAAQGQKTNLKAHCVMPQGDLRKITGCWKAK